MEQSCNSDWHNSIFSVYDAIFLGPDNVRGLYAKITLMHLHMYCTLTQTIVNDITGTWVCIVLYIAFAVLLTPNKGYCRFEARLGLGVFRVVY